MHLSLVMLLMFSCKMRIAHTQKHIYNIFVLEKSDLCWNINAIFTAQIYNTNENFDLIDCGDRTGKFIYV